MQNREVLISDKVLSNDDGIRVRFRQGTPWNHYLDNKHNDDNSSNAQKSHDACSSFFVVQSVPPRLEILSDKILGHLARQCFFASAQLSSFVFIRICRTLHFVVLQCSRVKIQSYMLKNFVRTSTCRRKV